MPSTGYQNGTDVALYVDGDLIAYGTSDDNEVSMETRDASNKGSAGWAEKREGQRSWTMSGEFIFAEDSPFGYADLFALIEGRSQVVLKQSTEVVGDVEYSGSAYLTSLSKSTPNEDTATYSASFEGTGALSPTTIVA